MKKKHYLLAGLFVLMAIAWFLVEQGGTMQAADEVPEIHIDGTSKNENGVYVLRRKKAHITLRKPISGEYVSIDNISLSKVDGKDAATFTKEEVNENGVTYVRYLIEPKIAVPEEQPLDLTIHYRIGNTQYKITPEPKIAIPYAIDENSSFFGKLYEEDKKNSVILAHNEKGKLDFVFEGTGVTWGSENSQVIKINPNTGEFTATGTGKTQVRASYVVEGESFSLTVPVYVGPNVTDGKTTTGAIKVSKKAEIETGANYSEKAEGVPVPLIEKINWDAKRKIGKDVFEPEKDVFTYRRTEPNLTINGYAGNYEVDFYTAGLDPNRLIGLAKDKLIQSVELSIYAECKNFIEIALQKGDLYNLAEAYNMTASDFKKYFNIDDTGVTGCKETDGIYLEGIAAPIFNEEIHVSMYANKSEFEKEIPYKEIEFDIDHPIIINATVYNGLHININAADILLGASLDLRVTYGTANEPQSNNVEWSISDENILAFEAKEGVKARVIGKAKGSARVTAAMKMEDGRVLKAHCNVTVYEGTGKGSLILQEEEIRVGNKTFCEVVFEGDTVTSNLKWSVINKEIATITEENGRTALVQGKKAGQTLVMAINRDTSEIYYATIYVVSYIEKIELNKYEIPNARLNYGEIKLLAKIIPADATKNKLLWETDNPEVATVNDDGLVTLKGAGEVTIKVIADDERAKPPYAKCKITVLASTDTFSLNSSQIVMEANETKKIVAKIKKDTTPDIKWTSMDGSVATVSSNGKLVGEGEVEATISAKKPGQTYIIASTVLENGNVETAKCLVTVTQKATGVKLSDYNVTVNVGESYKVTATPNPTTSTEKSFKWESEKPSIASVKQDGTITGVSAGSTIIRVFPESGKGYAVLYVTVKDKAKGMELNYSAKSIAKGSSFTLKPIFTPTNVTNKKVTWTSSNRAIATVDSKGKVKGIKGGSAIITAVSEDGGYVATCLVTVVQPVSKIELNHNSYKLGLGKTVTLKADVSSNSSSNPKVKWTSSNTKIATVSSTGKVKAKKLGTCTITARVTDGTNKKATCKITVVRQATSVKLNRSYLTLVAGKNYRLKATVKPSNATYKTVKWSSTNSKVARVDDAGLVRGIALGSCNIKAAAKDNSKKSDTCYVEVIEPVPSTSILVADKNMVMIRGESQMLSYTIVPANSTDDVKFASANRNIATVSGTGKVYARRAGTTNITITTSSGKQTVIQLQVIGLNKTSVVLEQYDTETLFVDGVTSGISWYSANPGIATVVNGKIVGRKSGTTMIYAKVSGITLGCRVTVKNIS